MGAADPPVGLGLVDLGRDGPRGDVERLGELTEAAGSLAAVEHTEHAELAGRGAGAELVGCVAAHGTQHVVQEPEHLLGGRERTVGVAVGAVVPHRGRRRVRWSRVGRRGMGRREHAVARVVVVAVRPLLHGTEATGE